MQVTSQELVSRSLPVQCILGTSTSSSVGSSRMRPLRVERDETICPAIVKLMQNADNSNRRYADLFPLSAGAQFCPSEDAEKAQLATHALNPINQLLIARGSTAKWEVGGEAIQKPPAPGIAVVDSGEESSSKVGPNWPTRFPDFGLILRSTTPDGYDVRYIVPGEVKKDTVIAKACNGESDFDIVRAYNSSRGQLAQNVLSQLYEYLCASDANWGILASYPHMFVVRRQEDVLQVSCSDCGICSCC